MMENKGLWAIGIVIVVLFLISQSPRVDFFGGRNLFAIIEGTESSLKQEWNTYWSNNLDGVINLGTSENDLFRYGGSARTDDNSIWLSPNRGATETLITKKNFYGQNVILYMASNDITFYGVYFKDTHIIELRPHTLNNNRVDVLLDGITRNTIEVTNPFYPEFSTTRGGTSSSDPSYYLEIKFIGYKALFSCDLANDEVWIQESFVQSFNINDLSFPPTKFCRETRPFVLRDIQQGETPLSPNPIPAFNRGETLNPNNNIITVNYATPNVAGVTQPCDVDQANVKVAGRWICSQVIKTTTITGEVPIREIITVSGANQFTATSNFNIGDSVFAQTQKFNCQIPNDVDIVRFPSPNSDCYTTTISYEGKSYDLKDKRIISLNNFTTLQYFAGGQITRDKQTFGGVYVFNILNPFVIDVQGGLTLIQQQQGTINLKITNNLPNNEVILKIKQKVIRINTNLPEELNIKLNRGINDISFDIDTSNLGINEIIIQVFYPINADAKVLIPSDIIKINTEIIQEGDTTIVKFIEIEKITEKEKLIEAPESKTKFSLESIPTPLKILAVIFIFIAVFRII